MNVPNIAQGPGAVTTVPRAPTGGETASSARAAASSAPEVSFTRLAWFDANGDGDIDPRPAGAGGDATLLVPAHAVDLPTYSRHVQNIADMRVLRSRDTGDTPNSAQTRQALAAYQRYGQTAPAPAPPVDTTPPPVVLASVGAPAAPPVVAAASGPAPAADTASGPAPAATAA